MDIATDTNSSNCARRCDDNSTIRLSHERLCELFHLCPYPALILAEDYTIVDCNQAVIERTGRNEQFWVGKVASELAVDFPALERLLRSGKHVSSVTDLPASEDSQGSQSVTSFPIQMGETGLTIAIFKDSCNGSQTTKPSGEQRYLLSDIVNAIPSRIFWKDLNLKYLGCNELFAKDAGLRSPDEIAGKDDFSLCWKEQAHSYRADDSSIIESGVGRQLIEETQTTPDGRLIHLLTSKVPLKDSDGNVAGVLGTYLDITDRMLSEERNRLLATAIEQSSDAIVITNSAGTIEYANRAFEKVTGYSVAEAIGQNPRILKSGRHDVQFYDAIWRVLKQGQTWHGQLYNKQKDGTVYPERMTISPVLNDTGACTHYVAIKRDISHEIETEQMLIKSQKLEAVGRLAGGIAHDFNNILTVITGYSELLVKKLRDQEKLSAEADEIRRAAIRASSLTRQLLTFSRGEVTQNQPIDLNALLEQMLKMLTRIVGEDVVVEFASEVKGVCLSADPGQIEQILMNLTVNARDAMPAGGTLRFSIKPVTLGKESQVGNVRLSAGTYVTISVSDTGTGMSANTISHLFEPFFTTKVVGKGTGLGLAIVYNIVCKLNGAIEVLSTIGEGTTFIIYLPYENSETIADSATSGRNSGSCPPLKVLLVEDDLQVKLVVAQLLRDMGCEIIDCGSPFDALDICSDKSTAVDLVLSDVRMPGLHGNQLAKMLKSVRPNIKILLMSGNTDTRIADSELDELGVSMILKPFSREQLAKKIRQVNGAPDTQSIHL